jgi:hypothetical protein
MKTLSFDPSRDGSRFREQIKSLAKLKFFPFPYFDLIATMAIETRPLMDGPPSLFQDQQ